jgi:hypothetical protein
MMVSTTDQATKWLMDPEKPPVVYHVGLLMYDRQSLPIARREKINKIATKMYKACRDGHIILWQRRIGDGICEYHAAHV